MRACCVLRTGNAHNEFHFESYSFRILASHVPWEVKRRLAPRRRESRASSVFIKLVLRSGKIIDSGPNRRMNRRLWPRLCPLVASCSHCHKISTPQLRHYVRTPLFPHFCGPTGVEELHRYTDSKSFRRPSLQACRDVRETWHSDRARASHELQARALRKE